MSGDLGEKGRVWLGQELGRVPTLSTQAATRSSMPGDVRRCPADDQRRSGYLFLCAEDLTGRVGVGVGGGGGGGGGQGSRLERCAPLRAAPCAPTAAPTLLVFCLLIPNPIAYPLPRVPGYDLQCIKGKIEELRKG